mgnify:CR=1 FL=1|jgi:transposase-like protein
MLPFGKSPKPFENAWDLKSRNVRIENDILKVDCDRCNHFTQETKHYKIHFDDAISFHFNCTNCHWSYSIKRNSLADYKPTEKVITKK